MPRPNEPGEYEELICPYCNGSGEGMYEGTRCRHCKGSGVEYVLIEDEEEEETES